MSLYRFFKRLFDITVVLLLLPLALPLIALVSLFILLTMGRPVLFRQNRVGLHEKIFELYKFRTMMPAPNGDLRALTDAQRLTPVGKFIRKTSLDELPQLFNVLKGDMSIVGPRPLLDIYLPRYSETQKQRHFVPAGITGWAQINGRNTLDWSVRLEQDVWYVNNCSFLLDMKIIAGTIRCIFNTLETTQPGHATCEEFKGNQI